MGGIIKIESFAALSAATFVHNIMQYGHIKHHHSRTARSKTAGSKMQRQMALAMQT